MKPFKVHFHYVCVTCGHKDTDTMECDQRRPDETIRLVRCEKCTRKSVPLPELVKA